LGLVDTQERLLHGKLIILGETEETRTLDHSRQKAVKVEEVVFGLLIGLMEAQVAEAEVDKAGAKIEMEEMVVLPVLEAMETG
jgi:hypothetical protein